jgi:hypothetical protein
VAFAACVLLGSGPGCGEQPAGGSDCELGASCDLGITPGSIAWVDASHCVSPCDHPVDPDLVTLDPNAIPSDAGAYRFGVSAAPALRELLAAATAAGFPTTISSAYRTHADQLALWNDTHVTEPGRAARPGHSEHELGLAADLDSSDAGYVWLAQNAWRSGFALSFPRGLEKVTGFRYEPWHFRYVGLALARQLFVAGIPLEELLKRYPSLGLGGDCSSCSDPASNETCEDTAAGRCENTLLLWCFDGTETRVDCALSNLRCGAALGPRSDGNPACTP